ncbi:MAG: nucleotidyltransferase family protein [Deltaproteobacteria bacterium]
MEYTEEDLRTFVAYWKAAAPEKIARSEERKRAVREKLPAAAALLRARGAKRIWLIGSMVAGLFHDDSDVDLVTEGLPWEAWDPSWNDLVRLFQRGVDVLRLEELPEAFRKGVRERGAAL